ncbi:hypothetical protein V8B97DRAFT_1873972 [Scleroderma yunnanense]
MDNDVLVRAWLIIHELSDLLAQNHKTTNALIARSALLKEQAAHCSSGFTLRRINLDISKEVFESELERTNAQLVIENQTLLHENKQLDMLLKEHETTLDSIMTKFRHHAMAAQQHELTLTHHYEGLLLACDSQSQYTSLSNQTCTAHSLQCLAFSLRALYRTLIGEDPEATATEPLDLHELIQALSDDAPSPGIQDDWAMERECEIARLQKENEDLRKALGIDAASLEEKGIVLDMEREACGTGRYATLQSEAARRRSESTSSGGSRFNAWGLDNESPRENTQWAGGWDTNMAQQQQQQQLQLPHPQLSQQHPVGNGKALQRALDLPDLPGIARLQQPRRPILFARGGGPAPPVSVGPSRSIPPSQWSQQAWSQAGSTLDLSR